MVLPIFGLSIPRILCTLVCVTSYTQYILWDLPMLCLAVIHSFSLMCNISLYFTVWLDHNLFICSTGHLDWWTYLFPLWGYFESCCHRHSSVCLLVNIYKYIKEQKLGILLGIELLLYVQLQYTAPVLYTAGVCEFLFLHILTSTWCSFFQCSHSAEHVAVMHWGFNLYFSDD